MKLRAACVVVGILSLTLSLVQLTVAQGTADTASALPRLVRLGGTVKDLNGNSLTGVVGVTFALYSEQSGGAPLWLETQNVTADNNGHYVALLGTTQPDGLPTELFISEQARWVGVQVLGQAEQPRVLLVSTPYAFKAGDAETLGGLPPSAFVLNTRVRDGRTNNGISSSSPLAGAAPPSSSDVTTTGGTVNTIPLFTTATNIQNSILTQTGTTAVSAAGNLTATGIVTGSSFQIGSNLFAFGSHMNFNAFLGFAGNSTMTGTYNAATGANALLHNTTGTFNTATGTNALYSNTTGTSNLASGNSALYSNTTGNQNAASGNSALYSNTIGSYNVATGYHSLYFNTTGANNTASGYQAMYNNTTGYDNTASGASALESNTTGYYNTASGFAALYANATGVDNTASGYQALRLNTTGTDNTANGFQALQASAAGSYNVAVGSGALYSDVGDSSQDGWYNTAVGYKALYNNNSPHVGIPPGSSFNAALGTYALFSNTIGGWNTAVGPNALYSNTIGTNNVANGNATLYYNTTGSYNTAYGNSAMFLNTTGFQNTAIGASAGMTGFNDTCIGYSCGADGDGLNNATAIGALAHVSQSNSLVLGGIQGFAVNVGIGTTAPSNVFTIAQGSGHAISDGWDTYSSRRWKTNIHTLHGALGKVEQLRGVTYDLKANGKHEVGVIAEEVAAIVPEVVAWEKDGKDAQSVDYGRLTALLIEATKEQQREIQHQQAALRTQAAAIRDLKSELQATRETLQKVKAQVSAIQPALVAAK